ncbi:hypothetical protein DPMN_149854 [Dreissena polymorpha]|uniref:Uncharacterized protein n=1 Tax=Dreissena polymorpha TaxID=45954 RepID=A0A9D4FCJ5_DREPO|nr:hypothetical protein DPMN_149854 [Dreissena polymorpha]
MVIVAGFTVNSANKGLQSGLYRPHHTLWSSSRVKSSAAQAMVINAGLTISSAHNGYDRGVYRQHRSPWSSSRF